MSSAAAHWSPAVTELVQLVRTRWRENCFVGTKKRFQLCFETRELANVRFCCWALVGQNELIAQERNFGKNSKVWLFHSRRNSSVACHRMRRPVLRQELRQRVDKTSAV